VIQRHPKREAEETPAAARRAAARQDLCFKMKKWPRVQFDSEVRQGGELAEAVRARDEGTWEAVTREFFGRLYDIGTDALDAPREGAEWAKDLHDQADLVPEFADLRGRVAGDPWRSGLAAGTVARVLADRLPELPEEDVEALQAEADWLSRIMAEGGEGRTVNTDLLAQRGQVQRRLARARDAAAGALEQMQRGGGMALRSALREAGRAASEAVEELDDGMRGLGWGSGAGTPTRRRVAQRLANNDQLRRIAALAGRLRAQARQRQKVKSDREREEMHGVEKGDQLHRLLSSEVGLLPGADTRPLLLMRIAEKQALQYKLRGRTPKSRGPIVFAIDTSGSMSGAREVWAKAAALAMMEIARLQKRAFAIVYFSGEIEREDRFDPRALDDEALMESLEFFSSGGTDIANAIDHAASIITDPTWRPGKKADLVLVTDGVDGTSKTKALAKLAAADARLYTICIDCECPPDLVAASADVARITGADMAGASRKLDHVFSV